MLNPIKHDLIGSKVTFLHVYQVSNVSFLDLRFQTDEARRLVQIWLKKGFTMSLKDFHTSKNKFGLTSHVLKSSSEKLKQMQNTWQPLWDCGSTFHHTAAQICLLLIVPKRSVKAFCSTHRGAAGDTLAAASSFRANGARIRKGRWAPLNPTEETNSMIVWRNQYCEATGGVWERWAIFIPLKSLMFGQETVTI